MTRYLAHQFSYLVFSGLGLILLLLEVPLHPLEVLLSFVQLDLQLHPVIDVGPTRGAGALRLFSENVV